MSPISQAFQEAYDIEISPSIDQAELQNELENDGSCKKICYNHIVKILSGSARYSSGQVYCQTCDVWLDYGGCHGKNGSPAEKDTWNEV